MCAELVRGIANELRFEQPAAVVRRSAAKQSGSRVVEQFKENFPTPLPEDGGGVFVLPHGRGEQGKKPKKSK